MKKLFLIITISLCTSYVLTGQSFFDKVTANSWTGSGKLMGAEATFTMNWEWVLDQQFLNLNFQNKRKSESGTDIAFKGKGFYKPLGDSKFEGTWFDSRGISFPLKATLKDDSFIVEWGSKETEQGKTEYTLTSNGGMQVKDYVLQNGQYAQFAEANYQKGKE